MPCGGNWGLLQPVPRRMVLWVAGKLFSTGLMSDFFIQLITLRACLELVGAFFRKSGFCLLFPLGMSPASAEAGQSRAHVAGCSPTAAAMSFCGWGLARGKGKGPAFLILAQIFYDPGLGAELPGQRWGVPGGCGCSGKGTA